MLDALINEANAIDFNLIAWRVLSRHTEELVALQKSRLHKGQATNGSLLPLPYSKSHASRRAKAGRPIGVKDLDFTGEHFSQMYTIVNREGSLMGSNDDKSIILESIYKKLGQEIYGLSDEDIDYVLWELGWAYEMQEEYQFELFR